MQPNTKFQFSGSAGVGQLKLDKFKDRTFDTKAVTPLWKMRATYIPVRGTDIRLEGNEDYSYMGWLDQWSRSQVMAVRNLFAEVDSFTIEKWQFRSNARWSYFSDSNVQHNFDELILRELFSLPFVLKVGVGGGWMGFRERYGDYWHPEYFEFYGARFIVLKDFLNFWTFELRSHVGYHREQSRPREADIANEVFLTYRDRSGWLARIRGNFVDTERSAWWRNDVGINIEVPL
jgi:hypothetical protein